MQDHHHHHLLAPPQGHPTRSRYLHLPGPPTHSHTQDAPTLTSPTEGQTHARTLARMHTHRTHTYPARTRAIDRGRKFLRTRNSQEEMARSRQERLSKTLLVFCGCDRMPCKDNRPCDNNRLPRQSDQRLDTSGECSTSPWT